MKKKEAVIDYCSTLDVDSPKSNESNVISKSFVTESKSEVVCF